MADPTCKGSFALGSACAGCSRCRDEWVKLRRDGWRLISPEVLSGLLTQAYEAGEKAQQERDAELEFARRDW